MSTATTALTEQEFAWVQDCARHLRLVQADAASGAPEARQELLREEVAGKLKEVSPANRGRLLKALLNRFPVAGQVLGSAAPPPAPIAVPAAAVVPETPEELLKRFLPLLPTATAEQRAEWTEQLARAGLIKREVARSGPRVPTEWLPAFGLQENQQPEPERLVALAALLAELVQRVEQASRKALVEFRVPDRGPDLLASFSKYLNGELETVEPQVRALLALLCAVPLGMIAGTRRYEKDFLKLCAPTAIEDTIKLEGGGSLFGKSFEARCWEKYKDLARGFAAPNLIGQQIRDGVGTEIKTMLAGKR